MCQILIQTLNKYEIIKPVKNIKYGLLVSVDICFTMKSGSLLLRIHFIQRNENNDSVVFISNNDRKRLVSFVLIEEIIRGISTVIVGNLADKWVLLTFLKFQF